MDEFKKDFDDYFCRFTFGQFVTLILLEFVTLFVVFYLGAHYGPSLIGASNATAQKDVLPKNSAKSVEDIVGTPPVDYTYPDVLTGKNPERAIAIKPSGVTAEEYEKRSRQRAAAGVPVENPSNDDSPVVEEAKPAKPEPVEKPVKKEAPKVENKGEELPADNAHALDDLNGDSHQEPQEDAPAASSRHKFTVQVGSYPTTEEAQKALGRWKKKGYSAFLSEGQIPDKGTWYRVRIGGFDDKSAADAFLQKLKTNEKTAGIVVVNQ